jgi:hypothetical protein
VNGWFHIVFSPNQLHTVVNTLNRTNSAVASTNISTSALFRSEIFWRKISVALSLLFGKNLSNHGLTRLKKFVSTFTDKLCN